MSVDLKKTSKLPTSHTLTRQREKFLVASVENLFLQLQLAVFAEWALPRTESSSSSWTSNQLIPVGKADKRLGKEFWVRRNYAVQAPTLSPCNGRASDQQLTQCGELQRSLGVSRFRWKHGRSFSTLTALGSITSISSTHCQLLLAATETSSMQASTQANALVQEEEFVGEPEREDYDMEVELGVNLVDAFTKKHVLNFNGQAALTQSPVSWAGVVCPPPIDTGGLLPASCYRDGDRPSSMGLELDDVAQEILSKALLEDQDATSMEVDSTTMPFLDSEDLSMVVFLYAFEKFRIVYA